MTVLADLPPEIFFHILEYITEESFSKPGALAVLNFAASCRTLYHIISSYAPVAVHQNLKCLKSLGRPGDLPNILSLFCRRLASICSFCPNRARYWTEGEIFNGLLACQGCEARHFPKISMTHLGEKFERTAKAEAVLESVDRPVITTFRVRKNRIEKHKVRVLRWEDVRHLVDQKILEPKPVDPYWKYPQQFICLEEYSDFGFCHRGRDLGWGTGSPLEMLFLESYGKWHSGDASLLSPIEIEKILFCEFRYRFDHSWVPKSSPGCQILEYLDYAQRWATHSNWSRRPWRLEGFPDPPRNSITSSYLGGENENEDNYAFERYNFECTKIRGIIESFPDILRSPGTWIRCMESRNKNLVKVMEMAKRGETNRGGEVCADMEFELKSRRNWDVILLRRTKKLKDRALRATDCIDGSLIVVSVRDGTYMFRAQHNEPNEPEGEVGFDGSPCQDEL
jgi:hypothetical protein